MKKIYFLIIATIGLFSSLNAQNFNAGEFLKFRVHYTGLNAGYATLEVQDAVSNGKNQYKFVGQGKSIGAVRAFFKVDDYYESNINKSDYKPTKFIRKINEGGYTRDQAYIFDYNKNTVKVEDYKYKKEWTDNIPSNVQDVISAFYSMRNNNYKDLKVGNFINENIFLGDETYKFRLKVLGREIKKTKFGYINTIKIRPYVQSGRVFKESESVTMWVSDDENLVPIHIKASLMVGSLNAELMEYKNLKFPIKFTQKK